MATKEEAIKLINDSKETDFVVRSTGEETTFLENHKKTVIETAMKPEVFKIHSAYAKDFKDILGIEVPEGKKPYKVLQELGPDIRRRADETKTYQEKVDLLEKQIKDGVTDGVTKSKIDQLEKDLAQVRQLHKDSEKTWESKLTEEKQSAVKIRKRSDLSSAILGFKFIDKSVMPEDVRQNYIEVKIAEAMQLSDYDEHGVLYFKDQNGNKILDQKTMVPITAAQFLTEKLTPIIDKGIQQPGLGADGKPIVRQGDTPKSKLSIPPTVDSRMKLTTFLTNLKETGQISQEEYNLAYSEHYKELKIA
jgi:hypothetical protein